MAPRKTTTKKRKTAPSQKTIRDYKPINHEKIRKPKKYKQRKVPGTDKVIDRALPAKPVGWRVSDSGKVYFEDRENRSDTDKEIKYHAGVNRRAKPGSRTGQPSTRSSHSKKTTRRVAPVRKRDPQKPPRVKVTVYVPKQPTRKQYSKEKFYNLDGKKKLTAAQLKKLIKSEELRIHEKKVENCIAFDREKGVYYTNIGGSSSVGVNPAIMGERFVLTHNHPNDYGFANPLSGADLSILLGRNLYEIRACCYGFVYVCRKGTCNTPGVLVGGKWDALFKDTAKRVQTNLLEFKEIEGESDADRNKRLVEYDKLFQKKLWYAADKAFKTFCANMGLEYKKVKI